MLGPKGAGIKRALLARLEPRQVTAGLALH
jgi:hypothetical protein